MAEPPASYRRGTCRSCGAMILWAEMEASGKHNPLDYVPDPEKGNVILLGHGMARALSMAEAERIRQGPTLIDPGVEHHDLFLSHFAVCEHRDQHRRKRR